MVAGKVVSVVQEKGFGFLNPDSGGEDLFFHHSAYDGNFAELQPGQPVTFEWDHSTGKPRAKSIKIAGDLQKPPPPSPSATEGTTLGHVGKITDIVSEKGFGFIGQAEGGDDLFFHHSSFTGDFTTLQIGQAVTFEPDTNAEKPRAKAVAISGSQVAPVSVAGKHAGRIASVSIEKRFGFINPDEKGDDLFFHQTAYSGDFACLQPGQTVTYDVDPSSDKPRASSVVLSGDALSAVQRRSKAGSLSGVISSMRPNKGFGFITPEDGRDDLFFHQSTFGGNFAKLQVGQPVTYELDETADKPRASFVATKGRFLTQPSDRPLRDFEFGYVTKLYRKRSEGFISANKRGPELLFESRSVSGIKPFMQLQVGDYVQFARGKASADPEMPPMAVAVSVQEKEIPKGQVPQLPNNPKARRKKPTWR